jgi:hypothetical protein
MRVGTEFERRPQRRIGVPFGATHRCLCLLVGTSSPAESSIPGPDFKKSKKPIDVIHFQGVVFFTHYF